MRQTNISVLSIRLHNAVIEAKQAQIITNLFEPPLGNINNHQKKAEVVKALSESEAGTVEGRGTNTDPRTKASGRSTTKELEDSNPNNITTTNNKDSMQITRKRKIHGKR
jgi:hypothetical protein